MNRSAPKKKNKKSLKEDSEAQNKKKRKNTETKGSVSKRRKNDIKDAGNKKRKKYRESSENRLTASYYINSCEKAASKGSSLSLHRKFRLHFPTLINIDPIVSIPKNKENRIGISNDKSCLFYRFIDFIGCFDCSENFIYLGLKADDRPFNIFEIKEGKSQLAVLDMNLNLIQKVTFDFGDILQIKIHNQNIFVLFSNGNLMNIGKEKEIKSNKMNHFRFELDSNFINLARNEVKPISFDCKNNKIVYTNGSNVYIDEVIISYNTIIIQILIVENSVYCLDIQGKVFELDIESKNKREMISNYSIERIQVVDKFVMAIARDEYYILNVDQTYNMGFIGFFNMKEDGNIQYTKRYKNRRKNLPVLQIIENEAETKFIIRENTGSSDFISCSKVFIPKIVDFNEFFILATESGIVAKIYYI